MVGLRINRWPRGIVALGVTGVATSVMAAPSQSQQGATRITAAPRVVTPVSEQNKKPQTNQPVKPNSFRIIIPSIGLDVPVARGTDDKALSNGPGYDPYSAAPGERGNTVIAGHRNIHGSHFWYLTNLKPNSIVTLQTPTEYLDYKVVFTRVVPEADTKLLEEPTHTKIAPRLTLYTCTLPVSPRRFIAVANLYRTRPATPAQMTRANKIPRITSGPLHLLKDNKHRVRLGLKPMAGRWYNWN